MFESSFALVKALMTLAVLGVIFAFLILDHRRNLPAPRDSGEEKSERES
jgi:hypothetical protein